VTCEVQLSSFCKAKKGFLSIQKLISCNPHGGNSEIVSTSIQTSVLQDHVVTSVQKCFFLNFDTCAQNGKFRAFGGKHSQGT